VKLSIKVDGKTYEVEVEASEPERVLHSIPGPQVHVNLPGGATVAPAAPAAAAQTVADESKVCRSPVNGTVVRVVAQPGDEVKVGDVLMVLEAMKMETTITAPVDAQIVAMNAAVSDAVKSGQVLVEFK
jgi:methylmalonyl-CoA carboxyltransferase small subunit